MTRKRLRFTTIVFALLAAPWLQATSSHTWVAGNGNDGNPCSVSQPCLTFQAAHNATTAGGMISVLSPGDFGAVTISKAITIDGGAVGGSLTFTGGQGIYIDAGISDTVILRHLVVNGLNTGSDAVLASQARYVIVEDCDLENFTQYGLAIDSPTYPMNVTANNTRIIGGYIGVRTYQTSNSVPLYVISMRNMVISGASAVVGGFPGAAIFTRNGTFEISDSLITQSAIGLEADTVGILNVANSVISNNGTDQISLDSSEIYTSNNNTLFGNNGSPGPPVGPQVVVAHKTIEQPPPDLPRHRHQ